MKKVLRIIAMTAGIISIAASVLLGCLYFEDIISKFKIAKNKIFKKIGRFSAPPLNDDFEIIDL